MYLLTYFHLVKSNKDYFHFKLIVDGHLGSTYNELGKNYYNLLVVYCTALDLVYNLQCRDIGGHKDI